MKGKIKRIVRIIELISVIFMVLIFIFSYLIFPSFDQHHRLFLGSVVIGLSVMNIERYIDKGKADLLLMLCLGVQSIAFMLSFIKKLSPSFRRREFF